MEITHIYVSDGHNYFGHKDKPPGENPTVEVDAVECVAGQGIAGDRFFDYRDDYKGQITFFAEEVFAELCQHFGVHDKSPSVLRRNIITRGKDLTSLIGQEFDVQGVRLRGTEECRPCFWMNDAFAQGAETFLRGRGGLRARILTNGVLRVTAPAVASA